MPSGGRSGAVQALMLKPSKPHVVTDDVQRTNHLAENQDPACTVLENVPEQSTVRKCVSFVGL